MTCLVDEQFPGTKPSQGKKTGLDRFLAAYVISLFSWNFGSAFLLPSATPHDIDTALMYHTDNVPP